MKNAMLRLISPLFIVMLAAFGGNALAQGGTFTTDSVTPSQAPAPVDCKKTPDHPRCKDKK